ncbi:MAG: CotH kinase family protein, partial [Gallionella sp.]|nr:CotH kinase family protein [Gallionella sp.]
MNIYKLLAVALLTLSAGVWAEQSTAASVKPGEQIPNSSGQTPAESRAEARTLAEAGAKAAKAQQDAKAAEQAAQAEAAHLQAPAALHEQAADFETWKEISLHLQAHGVQLVMDERDAASLFNKEPTDKSSFPVKFKDGDTVLNGRVSVKGSFTRNFLKKSLIIQFDNGATWHGQDRISLDAMSTDVTELHQWLAHDLMTRLNMATPEMLFTKLSINDRLVGRYLMVEWIKPAMFERFGLGRDGELYHPDDTFYCGNFQQEDIKRLQECFIRLDNGKDYSRLQQLAQDLISVPAEKFDEYLDKNFDGDSVINWLIVNTLAGSEDTYNKNFFLYYSNATHKWTVVPWDYDMAFGRVADVGVLFPRTIFNTHFQYLHSPESGAASPLKEKTLQNNALYKRFKAKVKDLFADVPLRENSIQGWYNPHNFSQILKEKRAETYRSIMSEMYPNPDKSEFDYMYDSLRFFNEWRYQYLNKLMLSASVWNTPIWLPYKSYDPVEPRPDNYWLKRRIEQLNMLSPGDLMQAGGRVFFSDTMLGTPLMAIDVLSLSKPSRFDVQVSSQQVPAAVPDEIDPAACIERTWHINNRTQNSQVMGNLEIDFLNEGSTRHELGDKIKNTLGLTVWSNIDGEWLPMSSEVNPRSNSFTVKNVVLDTGSYTLVACVSRTQEAIAMARKKVAQERAANRDNESVKTSRIEKQLRAHNEQSVTPPVQESSPTLEQKPFTIPPSADVKTSALDPRAAKQAAQAEAVRLKSEQKAKAEAQAQEKKAALAQAKQQAAQEQAAKVQAQKEEKAAKLAAAAAAKAEARAAADEKARAEADAKVAKLKAQQDARAAEQAAHAEAVRLKSEQKAKAEAQAQEKKAALAQAKQQAAQEQAAKVQAQKEEKAAKLAAAAAAKAEARAAA